MKPVLKRNYDTTALVAPASPDHMDFPLRFRRAVKNLEALTPNVILPVTGSHLPYLPAAASERTQELYQHLEDPDVDILMSVSGGYNSGDLLDLIDYDRLAENWKPLIGYSDITALQLAVYARKGMVSFYGPAAVPTFGEYPCVNPYSLQCLKEVLTAEGPVTLRPSQDISYSNYFWDREDKKVSVYQKNPGWYFMDTAGSGYTEGTLVGGNLDTMLSLAGSEYWIRENNLILFFEETHTNPKKLVRSLNSLRRTGILDNVRALLMGRPFCPSLSKEEFAVARNLLLEFSDSCRIPAVLDMDFGHSAPMLTIPIGVRASVDCRNREIRILEPAVTLR